MNQATTSFAKFALSVSFVVTLAACGGGGGGGGGASSSTTYSGQFIDAPTKGLTYTSSPSGLTGTTDANGTFRFQAGDVVSFVVPTSSGAISIGVYSPPTPASSTDSAIVHVSTMDNATQVAQTLQALGGTSSVIDVSNVNLTSTEKNQINDYIASGAVTTLPPKLTVSAGDALFNAMASLGNLPAKTNSTSLSSLLSGNVVVHMGVINAKFASGGWAGRTIRLPIDEISYFKRDNTMMTLCINSPWIDSQNSSDQGKLCDVDGITQTGNWAVPTGSTNAFTSTLIKYPSFLDTVTFKDVNARQGLYTDSQPNAFGDMQSFTGAGQYLFMSNTWNKSFLAGTIYYTGGWDQCTDGIMKFVYNSDATSFVQSCKTARVDGAPNTPIAGGTLSDVTGIPGLAKITTPDGTEMYVGVAEGSTPKSGRSILVKPGDKQCGTSGTVNGQRRSLSRCGSIKIVTYFN
jgi:hypothetical protein